jgi:hypothetical protein
MGEWAARREGREKQEREIQTFLLGAGSLSSANSGIYTRCDQRHSVCTDKDRSDKKYGYKPSSTTRNVRCQTSLWPLLRRSMSGPSMHTRSKLTAEIFLVLDRSRMRC